MKIVLTGGNDGIGYYMTSQFLKDGRMVAIESGSFDVLIERIKIVAREILELNFDTALPTQLCIKATRLEKIA